MDRVPAAGIIGAESTIVRSLDKTRPITGGLQLCRLEEQVDQRRRTPSSLR